MTKINNQSNMEKTKLASDGIEEVPYEMVFFAETLIEKAGLRSLPQDFFEVYSKKLAHEAMRRVGIMVMLKAEKKKIDAIFAKQDEIESNPAEAYKLIKSEIPDVKEIMENALKDFENEFLLATKKNV